MMYLGMVFFELSYLGLSEPLEFVNYFFHQVGKFSVLISSNSFSVPIFFHIFLGFGHMNVSAFDIFL